MSPLSGGKRGIDTGGGGGGGGETGRTCAFDKWLNEMAIHQVDDGSAGWTDLPS